MIMYQCSEWPRMVRTTPSATTAPTDVATRRRRVNPSTRPALIVSAWLATAISAGSAITAEKPSANPNAISSGREPRFAKALERFLPIGKMPSSSPCRNRATPTTTTSRPATIDPRPSGTVCKTMAWKKATTMTMGSRLRKECCRRCRKSLRPFKRGHLMERCSTDIFAWRPGIGASRWRRALGLP